MKLSFFGADQCVTGSCHCLEVGGKRILIDCGLQQGRDEVDNRSLPFAPGSIDYALITHAHIDHSGRVPMLIKNGFQGRILTTRLTAQLMSIMLQDSAHIQESDAEYKNRKNRRAGRPRRSRCIPWPTPSGCRNSSTPASMASPFTCAMGWTRCLSTQAICWAPPPSA